MENYSCSCSYFDFSYSLSFAGLAIFLLVFMAEVLAKMRMKMPEEHRMEKANLYHTSSAAQSL